MKKIRALLLCVAVIFTLLSPINIYKVEAAAKMSVSYAVHVQTYGDSQGWVRDGQTAGTSGEAKRLESIRIALEGSEYTGSVVYKTHCQTYGWLDWVSNGEASGTTGEAKRLEGIEIYLTGEVAKHYDITYRVHCQTYGWMEWVSNGEMAGTNGQAKRLEAIEIKLVPKGMASQIGVEYRTHCQTHGWLNWSSNGAENGTTGQAKRLEAIEIKLNGNSYSGGIQYRTHIQTYGWEDKMVSNGAMSGTSGQAKRLEAIEIELFGEVAEYYDVYYRVHAQSYGWLGWAKNGQTAGTSKLAKRLESIQIVLVAKEADASPYISDQECYIEGEDIPVYSPEAEAVKNLCNQYRSANGVSNMLTLDPKLTEAANIRAKEIAQYFDHTRPDGRRFSTVLDEVNFDWMVCGENIAAGYKSADYVMSAWMNSAGHRQNILNSMYNRIGVGLYKDPTSAYGYYWVQIFSN